MCVCVWIVIWWCYDFFIFGGFWFCCIVEDFLCCYIGCDGDGIFVYDFDCCIVVDSSWFWCEWSFCCVDCIGVNVDFCSDVFIFWKIGGYVWLLVCFFGWFFGVYYFCGFVFFCLGYLVVYCVLCFYDGFGWCFCFFGYGYFFLCLFIWILYVGY